MRIQWLNQDEKLDHVHIEKTKPKLKPKKDLEKSGLIRIIKRESQGQSVENQLDKMISIWSKGYPYLNISFFAIGYRIP